MEHEKSTGHVIDLNAVPDKFPTHMHQPEFWESLGRAVATFGFLEDVLSKAIFAFTATRHYEEAELEAAYKAWLPKLERALTDPLGNLIDAYGKAVREHGGANVENFDILLEDLRRASSIRNVICHGSWGLPDRHGATVPSFVNRQKEAFDTPVDKAFLDQLQRGTTRLACAVISTVTCMGWQFPGSAGPGKTVWSSTR